MMPFDFSQLRLDHLPFSDIALTARDMRRLRLCSKYKIFATEDDHLICYGLAKYETSCTGGSTMPKPNGYISITPRGVAFLNYRRLDNRRYLIPQLLSMLAVLVSLLSLWLQISRVP